MKKHEAILVNRFKHSPHLRKLRTKVTSGALILTGVHKHFFFFFVVPKRPEAEQNCNYSKQST